MDVSCWTDPYDESTIEDFLKVRWFAGLGSKSQLVGAETKIDTVSVESLPAVNASRTAQRATDEDDVGMMMIEPEIDPDDILDDSGMFLRILLPPYPSADQTTPFVSITDSFGRQRRVRKGSKSARTTDIGDTIESRIRQIASYDDI